MIKKIKNSILGVILKYNFVISLIITGLIVRLLNKGIVSYFDEYKIDILNMLISVSGTLFGFILTFLSVFIIFRTEEKYEKSQKNEKKPLIMLINNDSFNEVYKLFIKSSYSIGLLLIASIIYYFTTYGLNFIINNIFITIIIELIVISIIRVGMSVYTFNTLIKILIKNKQD